jgi:5-methylthioribose kinase
LKTITKHNIASFLTSRGICRDEEIQAVSELGGGVSSTILRIQLEDRPDLVVKQPLPQLKVQEKWLSDVRRVFNEIKCLKLLGQLLPQHTVPEIIHENQEQLFYIMSAAPRTATTWKEQLLSGRTNEQLAYNSGYYLGRIHAQTYEKYDLKEYLKDGQQYFHELRIDPYFLSVCSKFAEYKRDLTEVVDILTEHKSTLVHGDYSPKNMMVTNDQLMLIDFEVAHYGHPSFDIAFCLTHLVMKRIKFETDSQEEKYLSLIKTFWQTYSAEADIAAPPFDQTAKVLGAILLARVEGKSPAEYLNEVDRRRVHSLGVQLLTHKGKLSFDQLIGQMKSMDKSQLNL